MKRDAFTLSSPIVREIRHFHLFCGLGGGAKGFNKASPRVGNLVGKFRCIGGIDVNAPSIRDFERLTGTRGTVLDLFDRSQFIDFHGMEPPSGWRETGVLIKNRPGIDVMRNHDTPDTLFYVDPPYVHETRCRITGKGSAREYRCEMDDVEHRQLLDALQNLAGMVVLSGYPNLLYDDALQGWERHTTTARISGGRGTAIREEVVWLNPACARALHGSGLFSTVAA